MKIFVVSSKPESTSTAVNHSIARLMKVPWMEVVGYVNTEKISGLPLVSQSKITTSDVVIINGLGAFISNTARHVMLLAKKNNVEIIVYFHETAWNFRALAKRNPGLFERNLALLRAIDGLVWLVSEQQVPLVAFLTGLPFENFRIVYNVVDLSEDFKPRASNNTVIGAGLVNARKGVDRFVDIANEIAPELPKIAWDWYGVGLSSDDGSKKRGAHVRVLPAISNFRRTLGTASLFLLTSRDDPQPIVALEALAEDVPVVCFQGIGTSEFLPSGLVASSLEEMADIARRILGGEITFEPGFFRSLVSSYSSEEFALRGLQRRVEPRATLPDLAIPMERLLFQEPKLPAALVDLGASSRAKTKAAVLAGEPLGKKDYIVFEPDRDGRKLLGSKKLYRWNLLRHHPPRRLVVVGNGPSAVSSRVGDLIDEASIVLRINNFQTTGFEEFVGRKTSLVLVSPACKPSSDLRRQPLGRLRLYNPQNLTNSKLTKQMRGPGRLNLPASILKSIPNRTVLNLSKALDLAPGKWPSTGLTAVAWAHEYFAPQMEIVVHGFDLEPRGDNLPHYNGTPTKVDRYHDWKAESRLLNSLASRGDITLMAD